MFCLKILDENSNTVSVARGEEEVNLFYTNCYNQGDKIVLESFEKNIFIWLQFDDAIGSSLVYLKENNLEYYVPFGDKRVNLSTKAFYGNKHLIKVRKAYAFEISQYRNLSQSVVDHHKNVEFFPHISANVETRGEAVFAAQNSIDGVTISNSHGEWPFQSWGINQREDAKIKIDFGRTVVIDRIIVYLRTDFPHDNWWENGEFTFSDGTKINIDLKKTENAQEFVFEEKEVSFVEFGNLIKSDEPSPFPALTQIEVYGYEKSY